MKYKNIKSPIGNKLSCKGWQQEAAFRMLQNNLDENVAEFPEDLIVYGGYGIVDGELMNFFIIIVLNIRMTCSVR
mgnify:CR=1 FL=1